jgi:hypothetical protein
MIRGFKDLIIILFGNGDSLMVQSLLFIDRHL